MPLKKHSPTKGFTLLELLVVLVLISILFSFATLSLNTRPSPAKHAAYQIQQLLNLAQEDSILRGQIMGWTLTTTQQYFSRYQNQQWQTLEKDQLLNSHPLDPILNYQLQIDNLNIIATKNSLPQIIFLPDGSISHFELIVQAANSDIAYKIYTQQNTIKLTPVKQ
ncbi:MAG: general secretion pathway protein H [Methyloprofundus sp.]|nr:MAG: general secretion pathway protein H [Methyloprofundus sp.]